MKKLLVAAFVIAAIVLTSLSGCMTYIRFLPLPNPAGSPSVVRPTPPPGPEVVTNGKTYVVTGSLAESRSVFLLTERTSGTVYRFVSLTGTSQDMLAPYIGKTVTVQLTVESRVTANAFNAAFISIVKERPNTPIAAAPRPSGQTVEKEQNKSVTGAARTPAPVSPASPFAPRMAPNEKISTVTGILARQRNDFLLTEKASRVVYRFVGLTREGQSMLAPYVGKAVTVELTVRSALSANAFNAAFISIVRQSPPTVASTQPGPSPRTAAKVESNSVTGAGRPSSSETTNRGATTTGASSGGTANTGETTTNTGTVSTTSGNTTSNAGAGTVAGTGNTSGGQTSHNGGTGTATGSGSTSAGESANNSGSGPSAGTGGNSSGQIVAVGETSTVTGTLTKERNDFLLTDSSGVVYRFVGLTKAGEDVLRPYIGSTITVRLTIRSTNSAKAVNAAFVSIVQ